MFPVLALTVRGAANTCFFLVALSGLVAIGCRYKSSGKHFSQVLREYWPINLAFTGIFLAVLSNLISSGTFETRHLDSPLRFALFALVFWTLLLTPVKSEKYLEWGLIVGSLFTSLKTYHLWHKGAGRDQMGDFITIISFADMAMLLGVFVAFSIGWNDKKDKAIIAFKLVVMLASLYAVYISESRGAWIAIPVFATIALSLVKVRKSYKIVISLLIIFILGGVLSYGEIGKQRIKNIKSDIAAYVDGTNPDTAVGLRFQMWHGSWVLFTEHPLLGTGRQFYADGLKELSSLGIISPEAAKTGQGHSHQEVLYYMAAYGIIGLLALLLTYFVPAYYFFRELSGQDQRIRCAAGMGLALCLGFFVYGLTHVQFLWTHCSVFYSFYAALFLAYIVKRKESLHNSALLPV